MAPPKPSEIREAFQDYREEWRDIYDEGDLDMRAISTGGPWADQDRQNRESVGRPCIHLDQINQYLNQTIGNVRKNKRAIKAMPKSDQASKEDAAKRSSLIMGIEDHSQAQSAYLYAFECQIQRSFGFCVIRTEYDDDESFDQSIFIRPILNPRTVLLSPNYKQADASDVPEGFLLDRIPRKEYKRKYPDAKITDFSGEVMGGDHVSDWITEKTVQIAEYWRVEHDNQRLVLVDLPTGPQVFAEDEFKLMSEAMFTSKGLPAPPVKRERIVSVPRVMQYMTNGLEILGEASKWAGSRIPIISCFGPERWINHAGAAKRELISMVRFARDPQMFYDFLVTQECELAGMVPKSPFIGYKGQFESDKDTWEEITKVPHAYVQADLVLDGTNAPLDKPSRTDLNAPFQEYELAKDAAGRALQSAMGITPLPTAAQRRTEKSGVALEKIDDMESLGAFHFVDRYENGFLHNMGWQINELITPILDTERQMPIAEPDGTRTLMKIVGNTSHPLEGEQPYDVQGMEPDVFHTGKGQYDVTISTGPSYQSEREEQSAFVDQLIENMPNLPPPGTPGARVLALAIRMRPDLGPIGEQIADVFDPPDPSNLPPEAQAIVQQLQGQVMELQQENQALHMDRAGRVLEQQTKKEIEGMRAQLELQKKNIDYITQIVKAELDAKSKSNDLQAQADAAKELAILGFEQDRISHGADQAHEFAMRESAPVPSPESPNAAETSQ